MSNKNKINHEIDLLTGCLDKRSTEETIKHIIENSVITDEHVLILIDLDNFKTVNNTLGYSFGDSVLSNIGSHLRKIIRNGDVIGRIDGDTFVVFLRNASNFIAITQKVEEIAFVFRENFTLDNKSRKISCSIGLSCFNQKGEYCITYNDLYNQANSALITAKNKDEDQYCIFTSDITLTTTRKLIINENDLRYSKRGFERNILQQAFQVLQSTTDISTAINEILEMIGKEFNVSRTYIFELTDDGNFYCNTYEWCALGIHSVQADLQKVPLSEYTYVFSLLDDDGIFSCDDTTTFGGSYSELHQEQGVKSFLQGIVKENNISRLMLGLDECSNKRVWTERETTLIMYLSNLLGMFSRQLENRTLSLGFNKLRSSMIIDKLTGIPTKEKFFADTRELLKEHSDKRFFFMLINVNKFQMVNSFFGMDEGDRLLKEIAKDLNNFKNQSLSTCGRVGADIFCGCQEFISPIELILHTIIDKIKTTIKNYKPDYNLTISVGVYEVKNIDTPIEVMYTKAFVAAKKIKKTQTTAYLIYEDNMEEEALREQSIINDIYPALIENQFEVYLQPKVSLQNGDIIGAEALVRWNHPTKGFMSPGEFIPIFEKNGLVTKIDYFVLETVFSFLSTHMLNHSSLIPISVNISRVDLFNSNIVNWFKQFLKKYNIDPKYLHIEITESAYTENHAEIITVINELKQIGFHIEMDDFGTGYSSLNMFSDMIVDTIKLDMNFLRNLYINGDKINILSFIISLAKHFGLPVIAEGIETEEQMISLRNIGCDIGQGYYFARPMPIPQFLNYLNEKKMQKAKTEMSIKEKTFQSIELTDILYPNQQLNNFFNTALSATGMFEVKDGNIKLIRCNEEYYQVLGIQNRKLLFKNSIKDVFHEEDLSLLFSKINEAKKTKTTTSCNVRILKFSNEINSDNTKYHYINIRFKLINDSNQAHIYLATIFTL